ncbi:MAG: hypothetical protein HY738_05945 [Bacteroidia bacterium]|nr:hypothetical protein [Bacteroidia bacterium]
MPQRNTIDTDILVLVQNIEQLYKEFRNAGYKKTGALSIEGSTWISKDKEIIDVIESDEEWAEEAIKRPYFHDNLPVIALEYLVLMKFFSGRLQDIADISRMMALANDDQSKKVKIIIAKYLPSASEDLNSMIQLGKLELEK